MIYSWKYSAVIRSICTQFSGSALHCWFGWFGFAALLIRRFGRNSGFDDVLMHMKQPYVLNGDICAWISEQVHQSQKIYRRAKNKSYASKNTHAIKTIAKATMEGTKKNLLFADTILSGTQHVFVRSPCSSSAVTIQFWHWDDEIYSNNKCFGSLPLYSQARHATGSLLLGNYHIYWFSAVLGLLIFTHFNMNECWPGNGTVRQCVFVVGFKHSSIQRNLDDSRVAHNRPHIDQRRISLPISGWYYQRAYVVGIDEHLQLDNIQPGWFNAFLRTRKCLARL